MLTQGLPHLDSVVSSLTPIYREDIPFRCRSARDRGTRAFVEHARDRDCRWRGVTMLHPENAGQAAVFRSRYALDIYVSVEADVEDARQVGFELAQGIMTDAIGSDWRGVVATTTLQAVAVVRGEPVEFTEVVTPEGVVIALIVSIFFDIQHGSC